MKNFFVLAGWRQITLASFLMVFAVSAQAAYNIQIGQGNAPFQFRGPTTEYQVDATGIQEHQGVHGFVEHHNGNDTFVNLPGENYYITDLLVNESGQVAGRFNANFGGYGCQSFYWANGNLNVFSTGVWSDAHVSDMNNLGQVVGDFGFNGGRQGFVYDHGQYTTFNLTLELHGPFSYGGHTYRMNGETSRIDAINDYGQLYGTFGLFSGESFWYIASPPNLAIPEPGTITLLGLGIAVFAVIRKNRAC